MAFTVADDGSISPAPGKFHAEKAQVVSWEITYTGGGQITVTLMDFFRRKHFWDPKGDSNDRIDNYFNWIPANTNSLQMGGQYPNDGFLYAMIVRKPKDGVFGDSLSYAIHVTGVDSHGTSFDYYYDPDGDIKP